MKRTKLWWAGLTEFERRYLHYLENDGEEYSYVDHMKLIAKADNAVMEKEKQNENPGV